MSVVSNIVDHPSGARSRTGAASSSSAADKLQEINAKLAEVRQQRLQFAKPDTRLRKPRPGKLKPVQKKGLRLHHPTLEYAVAEAVYSPYMTKPSAPYPDQVYRMPEKLRSLKSQHLELRNLPEDLRPFDLDAVKRTFLNEIVNYNTSFVKEKPNRGSGPTPSSSSSCALSRNNSASSRVGNDDSSLQSSTYSRTLPEVRRRRAPSGQSLSTEATLLTRPGRSSSESIATNCNNTGGGQARSIKISRSCDDELYEQDGFEPIAAAPSPVGLALPVRFPTPSPDRPASDEGIGSGDLWLLLSSFAQMAHVMQLQAPS